MAKRNLARTAIEGGRHRQSRLAEYCRTRSERRSTRIALRKVVIDVASAEMLVLDERGDAGRSFADKLGPVYRWLETQVGRPWTKVYSEIRCTFDFRTTAGRHIVAHISDWVNLHRDERGQSEALRFGRFDFEINEHGILVLGKWRHGRPRSPMRAADSAARSRP